MKAYFLKIAKVADDIAITPVGEFILKSRKKRCHDREEFYQAIKDVVANKRVRRMLKLNHHSNTSCFKHSMHVAYYNYKICKLLGLDEKAGARAGMLHDLFLYDWHKYPGATGEYFHGLTHPKRAFINAKKEFEISELEKDIIIKHMWPLTIALPKYKETFVIVFTDKFCGFCEILDKYLKRSYIVAGA